MLLAFAALKNYRYVLGSKAWKAQSLKNTVY